MGKFDAKTRLIMLFFIFLNIFAYPVNFIGRNLEDICGEFSTCGTCKLNDKCEYLSGSCVSYDTDILKYEAFNQDQEYEYCKNSPKYGQIDLSGQHLVLSANQGASSSEHSLCEWQVNSDEEIDINVEINRDSENYESIRIEFGTEANSFYYDSNELTSCFSTFHSITLPRITYAKFKAKILDDRSSYTITISERKFDNIIKTSLWKAVFIILIIVPSGCAVILFIRLLCYCQKARRHYMRNQATKMSPHKLKHAKSVISNMQTGKYQDIDSAYDQTSCVICIEDFEQESDILITNECSHVFHFNCLNEWFENMRASNGTKCPICSTILTDQSKPRGVIHVQPEVEQVQQENMENSGLSPIRNSTVELVRPDLPDASPNI